MQGTSENEQKAVVVLDDYSVIVAEKEALQAFFADGRNLDELYGQVETMARGLVADVSTKEGISQVKGCARQIASVRKKVDDIGKAVVAELKALPGIIDNNRKRFREMTEALQDEIRRPVTEIEEREKEIDAIRGRHLNLANAASGDLVEAIEAVKGIPLTEKKWRESLEKAKAAVNGELNALNLMLESAIKREEEKRELEELRKKNAENERVINEQKIREAARAEGFAQGKASATATFAENEQVRRPIQAPEMRPTAPAPTATPMTKATNTAVPSKWTEEQKAVNNAIVAAIAGIIEDKLQGFTPSGYDLCAREIVKAVLKGQISNLKVEY